MVSPRPDLPGALSEPEADATQAVTSAAELVRRSGLDQALGVTCQECSPYRVVVGCEVGPQHLQPFGQVHGGVFASLVETACSLGANQAAKPGWAAVGMNNSTQFLRPVRQGGRLTCVATPVHQGASSQLWRAEVVDGKSRTVAVGEVRCVLVQVGA